MQKKYKVFVNRIVVSMCAAVAMSLLPRLVFADGGHTGGEPVLGQLSGSMMISIGSILFSIFIATVIYREPSVQLALSDYIVMILTTVTAFIHLALGIAGDWLLLLNGLGYTFFIVALFAPYQPLQNYRWQLQALLLVYTGVTLIGYFLLHPAEMHSLFDLATKAVELILILVLVTQLLRRKQ